MHALIIAAHGSRRQASNEEVAQLAQRIATQAGQQYDHYSAAFLELAEPSIEQAIGDCATAGAQTITLVPYFLAAGRHLAEDIPAIVSAMRQRLPQVTILVAPHLGASPLMIDALLSSAALAGPHHQQNPGG